MHLFRANPISEKPGGVIERKKKVTRPGGPAVGAFLLSPRGRRT